MVEWWELQTVTHAVGSSIPYPGKRSYFLARWYLQEAVRGRYLLGDLIIALIRMYMFRVLFYSRYSGVKPVSWSWKKLFLQLVPFETLKNNTLPQTLNKLLEQILIYKNYMSILLTRLKWRKIQIWSFSIPSLIRVVSTSLLGHHTDRVRFGCARNYIWEQWSIDTINCSIIFDRRKRCWILSDTPKIPDLSWRKSFMWENVVH